MKLLNKLNATVLLIVAFTIWGITFTSSKRNEMRDQTNDTNDSVVNLHLAEK